MKALHRNKQFLKMLVLTTALYGCVYYSFAQPGLPPRTITVTATQTINFGAFCVTGGVGGTITIGWDGSRTSTGGIVFLSGQTAQPAIFDIKLCQGRSVSITFAPTTALIGSNGGSLTMDIGPTEKGVNGASFSVNNDCSFITPLRVGGTLHVPGTAIPGIYTGSFDITLTQE